MATADEFNTFLSKRGYHVDVAKTGDTYIVSIQSRTVDEVTNLIASIGEPGRFVVAVKLEDIIPTIGNILGIVKLKDDVIHLRDYAESLEENMHRNTDTLSATDVENKRQYSESLQSLSKRFDNLEVSVNKLVDDISYIKQQPWWKRFLGVK